MLDLKGLMQYLDQGKNDSPPHVVIPLLGRFKGEDYQRWHILLAPNITDSGFEPRKWTEYLVLAKKAEFKFEGPAFCDKDGYVLSQQPFNDELTAQLSITREEHPTLFPPDMDLDDINTSCSFRKGSTSRARDLQLNESIIDANNRWRAFDQARGSRPSLKLRDHYSSTRLMSKKMLSYPQAMWQQIQSGSVSSLPRIACMIGRGDRGGISSRLVHSLAQVSCFGRKISRIGRKKALVRAMLLLCDSDSRMAIFSWVF